MESRAPCAIERGGPAFGGQVSAPTALGATGGVPASVRVVPKTLADKQPVAPDPSSILER